VNVKRGMESDPLPSGDVAASPKISRERLPP
jgi:hypothetical protein